MLRQEDAGSAGHDFAAFGVEFYDRIAVAALCQIALRDEFVPDAFPFFFGKAGFFSFPVNGKAVMAPFSDFG